jgi:hypothetical protein
MTLFQLYIQLRWSTVIPDFQEIFLLTKQSLDPCLVDRSDLGTDYGSVTAPRLKSEGDSERARSEGGGRHGNNGRFAASRPREERGTGLRTVRVKDKVAYLRTGADPGVAG